MTPGIWGECMHTVEQDLLVISNIWGKPTEVILLGHPPEDHKSYSRSTHADQGELVDS